MKKILSFTVIFFVVLSMFSVFAPQVKAQNGYVTITVDPSTLAIQAGHSAALTVYVDSMYEFDVNVYFSLDDMSPPYAPPMPFTYSFDPLMVHLPAGSHESLQLTISIGSDATPGGYWHDGFYFPYHYLVVCGAIEYGGYIWHLAWSDDIEVEVLPLTTCDLTVASLPMDGVEIAIETSNHLTPYVEEFEIETTLSISAPPSISSPLEEIGEMVTYYFESWTDNFGFFSSSSTTTYNVPSEPAATLTAEYTPEVFTISLDGWATDGERGYSEWGWVPTIWIDGVAYLTPNTAQLSAGVYSLRPSWPSLDDAYAFYHWETSGGVSVEDTFSYTKDNKLYIFGYGSLNAIFFPRGGLWGISCEISDPKDDTIEFGNTGVSPPKHVDIQEASITLVSSTHILCEVWTQYGYLGVGPGFSVKWFFDVDQNEQTGFEDAWLEGADYVIETRYDGTLVLYQWIQPDKTAISYPNYEPYYDTVRLEMCVPLSDIGNPGCFNWVVTTNQTYPNGACWFDIAPNYESAEFPWFEGSVILTKIVNADDDFHEVDVYIEGFFLETIECKAGQTVYFPPIEVEEDYDYTVEIRWQDEGQDYSDTLTKYVGAREIVEFAFEIVSTAAFDCVLKSEFEGVQSAEFLQNFGRITFDDVAYTLPDTVSKEAGSYTAIANLPDGYVFDHWQISGGVSVSDENSQTTTVTINNDGELIAVFKPKEPHLDLIRTYFPYYWFSWGERYYPYSFYGDLDDDVTNNLENYEADLPHYIYIHEAEDAEYFTIQYWMYYAYSDVPWLENVPLDHQHDWDTTIYVTFKKPDLSTPLQVTYFRHNKHLTLPWWLVPKIEGKHPQVFVAFGTHAAYATVLEMLPGKYPFDHWFPGGEELSSDDFSWILVFGNSLATENGEDSYSLLGYNYVATPGYGRGFPHPGPPEYGAWDHNGYWADRYLPEFYWPLVELTGADPAPWQRMVWQLTLPPPPNVIEFGVASPIDLHLYDPLGRHLGRNYDTGEIENEIPNANYIILPEGQFVRIDTPTISEYEIQLIGTGDGNYSFFLIAAVNDTWASLLYTGEIVEDAVYVYSISVTEEALTPSPDPMAELEHLKDFIEGLPDDVFDKTKLASQRKNALFNKIGEVILKAEAANYTDAINELFHDIRAKMDGDSTAEDWIMASDTQPSLCVIIDHIISSIETLQQD